MRGEGNCSSANATRNWLSLSISFPRCRTPALPGKNYAALGETPAFVGAVRAFQRFMLNGRSKRPGKRAFLSPHFSQAFYCGGVSGHVYCVALRRAPQRTVEYVCGALGRAPVSEAAYPRPSAPPRYETLREKCGLRVIERAFSPLLLLAIASWGFAPG